MTFTSALEQAEQLFTAAAEVGTATRPILLFYGLSQAGRALVAARAGDNEEWKLSGHGIKCKLSEKVTSVGEAKVRSDRRQPRKGGADRGAFSRVVDVLGSSDISTDVQLSDLWPLTIPANRFPLQQGMANRLIRLDVGGRTSSPSNVKVKVELYGLPGELYVDRQGSSGPRDDWQEQTNAVTEFLKAYPTLTFLEPSVTYGQPIGVRRNTEDGLSEVSLYLPRQAHAQWDRDVDMRQALGFRVGGYHCAFPSLDDSGWPVHPLVAWWAVLFGLSMLARYEPGLWGRATDVNQSEEAVPIEYLLQTAMDHVPELIHRALVGQS